MLDPVGSTSWHRRHLTAFRHLNDILSTEALSNPTVMIIGPGGVSRWTAPFLNDAQNDQAGTLRRLIGDVARYSDQILRRLPGIALRSLEPVELSWTLNRPHRLVVVDRSQRVLAAVARDLPHATCRCVDISFQSLDQQADVVIAFNVVCRLENKAAVGMAHVVEAVRQGGWLLIDDRSAKAQASAMSEFVPVAPKIYRHQCSVFL